MDNFKTYNIKNFVHLKDYSYPVYIGNLHEITIFDFAKEIIKLTNPDQKIIFKELQVEDPMQRQTEIRLAKKLLNR